MFHPDSITNTVAAVRGGLGIAVLPQFLSDRDPTLVAGPLMLPIDRFELWIVAHERLRHSPRVLKVRIGDVVSEGRVRERAVVVQQETNRPLQFELDVTRSTMRARLKRRGGTLGDYVFPRRNDYMGRMSTRQDARLVPPGSASSLTTMIRPRCGERRRRLSTRLPAIFAPSGSLGHAKIDSTVRYL